MNIRINDRKIVFHQTYNYVDKFFLHNYIIKNDILFFDDCLYSQYEFIKNNIKLINDFNLICIIGFSTKILRPEFTIPIKCANCAEYHDKIHANDIQAYNAYMSISEIKDLLSLKNVFLAGHGANHLKLENSKMSKLKKFEIFKNDIIEMKNDLKNYNLCTNIFVYPYAYDDLLLSDIMLKHYGFQYIFAGKHSKRIPIENIIIGNMQTE